MLLPYVGYTHNIQPQVLAINNGILSLLYEELHLGNFDLWNSCTNLISMFGQTASQKIDVNNIKISLTHISDFISNRELKNNKEKNILFLKGFGQIAFNFVFSIFKSGWDQLRIDKK